ncbi:MAG: hypothetical protein J7500_17050 [Sphingomonas sp.]|uniref:hypothetical protein n=1 Tax=Sphingomonas sp. TaxID=28214 RepID=UPI001AFD114B|nr:hypothetical protein [Sphingomonas sp.]MBO9624418.1 hypothetical protein [Sphingomonas sp.]
MILLVAALSPAAASAPPVARVWTVELQPGTPRTERQSGFDIPEPPLRESVPIAPTPSNRRAMALGPSPIRRLPAHCG